MLISMENYLREIDWKSVKEVCNRVDGFNTKANAKGIAYLFSLEIRDFEAPRVYSCLYDTKLGSGDAADIEKYSGNPFCPEFDAHVEKVKDCIENGVEVAMEEAYKKELEALNKKYGK